MGRVAHHPRTTALCKKDLISSRPKGLKGSGNSIRQRFYDLLVGSVTHLCYDAGLSYFRDHSSVLDAGIGNGFMIPRFHALIKSKGLHITGIDISTAALAECARRIEKYGLEEHIQLHCSPIESFKPRNSQYYDFIFFSQTFMLMNDQRSVLRRAKQLAAGGGELVFFQSMHNKRKPLLEIFKPKLKYLIGIDFGKVTYEDQFMNLLAEEKLQVRQDRLLQKSCFQWDYRIITAGT